ncbi:MAG: cytochrome c biogenesis CcdA family protein, partial [Anaerolineales bacterium]
MDTVTAVLPPNRRLVTFGHAAMFVLGFSTVFVVGWGGAATALGELFGAYKPLLGRLAGVAVVLFGLSTLDVIRLPWLQVDTRRPWDAAGRPAGFLSSSLMGVLFAAGWTPCIGTTLGAILTLGLAQETSLQAMVLASGYALGLGLPFLAIGLGIERTARVVRRWRRHARAIQIISGVFLTVVGLLMVTNRITWIAIWAQRNRFFLDLP